MKKFIAVFAILALVGVASPASASHWGEDITVTNTNDAYVKNDVDVTASTGSNDANGGYAGGGAGSGGSVNNSDDGNTGGNGGNAGNGGDGGVILTGNASAGSLITNDVNYNKTKITVDCGCNDVDDVTVTNTNNARVKNYVDVKAKTGRNNANGGGAGDNSAGSGGSVNNSDDGNTGGNGGDAGSGGWGGLIGTGDAEAGSLVVNVVNTNITRVRR